MNLLYKIIILCHFVPSMVFALHSLSIDSFPHGTIKSLMKYCCDECKSNNCGLSRKLSDHRQFFTQKVFDELSQYPPPYLKIAFLGSGALFHEVEILIKTLKHYKKIKATANLSIYFIDPKYNTSSYLLALRLGKIKNALEQYPNVKVHYYEYLNDLAKDLKQKRQHLNYLLAIDPLDAHTLNFYPRLKKKGLSMLAKNGVYYELLNIDLVLFTREAKDVFKTHYDGFDLVPLKRDYFTYNEKMMDNNFLNQHSSEYNLLFPPQNFFIRTQIKKGQEVVYFEKLEVNKFEEKKKYFLKFWK